MFIFARGSGLYVAIVHRGAGVVFVLMLRPRTRGRILSGREKRGRRAMFSGRHGRFATDIALLLVLNHLGSKAGNRVVVCGWGRRKLERIVPRRWFADVERRCGGCCNRE